MRIVAAVAGLLAGMLLAGSASANGPFTNGVPGAEVPLTGNEQFPADTNVASPEAEAISLSQQAGFDLALAGTTGWRNGLIGGDFGTNLWQRGTSFSGIASTVTYTADRWFVWGSGTSAIAVGREADVPVGTSASLRLQRASGNTSVSPICLGQVLASANSTRFQGQQTEFQFWLKAGANYSAGGLQLTASLVSGTGSDQSSAAFATGGWTGQLQVSQVEVISASWARYSVVGGAPSDETQLGVKLCWTPSGTAGANDWVEVALAQLDVNPNAVPGTGLASGVMASFEARPASTEQGLQYAYYYQLNEPASGTPVAGVCQATGATSNLCSVLLPAATRVAATETIAVGGTFAVNIAGTVTTLAITSAGTCGANSCTVVGGNTNTPGQVELLSGGGGSGVWEFNAEL